MIDGPLLALESVGAKAGPVTILDQVSVEITPGALMIVLGPNGAGKSTLLRLCHGLLRPSAGAMRWRPGPAVRQAMVFQRPVMLRRSVLGNAAYGLKLAGVPRAARAARAGAMLAKVGLEHLAQRRARSLSGGEQQRLALARAWALAPEILFLDEPTASLDPTATRQVEDVVRQMHAAGTAIVMTTHDLGQARRLGRDIAFLHGGRLVEYAPAAAFFARPASVAGQAFLAGDLDW